MMHDDPTIDQPAQQPLSVEDRALEWRGLVIDSYRVIDVLGEGGFGRVYLAEQTGPVQRRVALKVIKPGMDSRQVLARFDAERQALALMDHPSVAKVFDAGITAQGRPYFVMELVRGEPITRFCELERLGVDDRVRLMIQVCGAVQHAHMKGVLHRDLKPTNILVQVVDQNPLPKVIDFGVAKALHQPLTEHVAYTAQGQMVGTPEYVAPEQARGSADVDTRADVYALGVILYELLTGVTPVDSETLRSGGFEGLQRALESATPPAPSVRLGLLSRAGLPPSMVGLDAGSLARSVRGELDWIVMKCLEKERRRRYESAAALADDLERYLSDEPVVAGPPSVAYRASKFVRRHRVAVGAAAAVALALVAGVIGTAYGLAQAVRERERARAQATAAEEARKESEAVTSFVMQMLQSVQPEEEGRDVTVRDVLDAASERLTSDFADQPRVESRLRHVLGVSYWQLGRLDDAQKHLPEVVELRRKTLGPEHTDTLRATANLASLRLEQGRLDEAEQLMRQASDGFARTLGEDNALTLGVLNNLAVVHGRRSIDDEAAVLHRRVYEGQRRVQGAEHPHTLGAMFNLADVLVELNRLDEAEPLMREAAATWERVHGPDKPGTLLAVRGLAMLELKLGHGAAAEATIRRAVEGSERTFGPSHIDTMYALSQQGQILFDLNKAAEAEPVLARAWEGLRNAIGDDHPNTVHVACQLSWVMEAQGWPGRGEATVAEIIRTTRGAAQGSGLPASHLNNVAMLLLSVEPIKLRDADAALKAASKACELERGSGGNELWKYLDTLATAQHATGSGRSALASQQEALRLMPANEKSRRSEFEQRLKQYASATTGE